jgi:hypothetical protein
MFCLQIVRCFDKSAQSARLFKPSVISQQSSDCGNCADNRRADIFIVLISAVIISHIPLLADVAIYKYLRTKTVALIEFKYSYTYTYNTNRFISLKYNYSFV